MSKFQKNKFLTFCILLGSLLSVTNFDIQAISPSIDASYTYVYNSIFLGNYSSSIMALTYGPLGFLVHSLDIWRLKALLIFTGVITGVVVGSIYYLLLRKWANNYLKYSLAFLGIFVLNIQLFEWRLLCIYILALILVYATDNKKFLIVLSAFAAPAMLIKLSLGIACVILLMITSTLVKVEKRIWIRMVGVFVTFIVILGLALFRSTSLFASYITNGISVSSGYSEAMGMQPANWAIVIGLALLGLASVAASSYLILPSKLQKLTILFLAALFFVWKASVVRQDIYGHIEALPLFAIFVLLVSVTLRLVRQESELDFKTWLKVGLGSFGVVLIIFAAHSNGLTSERMVSIATNPMTFWRIEQCQLAPCTDDTLLDIDSEITTRVGSNTVDVYPWENLYIKKNNMRWKPRPSPASYGTYLPKLDNLNKDHWNSRDAPQYLLWDIRQGVLSIDGRHLFFDEPASLLSILRNYKYVTKAGSMILLEKHVGVYKQEPKPIGFKSANWGSWINVEDSNQAFATIHIEYEGNISQKVGSILFRPEPVQMEFRKRSGRTAIYRTVPKNLSQGIIVSQLPFDNKELISVLKDEYLEDPVVSYRFEGEPTGSIKIFE